MKTQLIQSRKYLSVFFAITFFMILFSCKKDPSNIKTTASSVTNPSLKADSNFVTFATAATAATSANRSTLTAGVANKQQVDAISGLPVAKRVLDSIAVPDNVNPSYYIFNYVGGGYSVIAADRRVEPVLAYAEKGHFATSGTLPSGLMDWLTVSHKNMQIVRKNPAAKISSDVDFYWREILPVNGTSSAKTKTLFLLQSCTPSTVVTTVNPLLHTAWAQGYPYDILCPLASNPLTSYYFGNVFGKAYDPTGCVATSMAQVMYYWKAPARYNWAVMPLTSSYYGSNASNTAVAQLMYDAGKSVNMAYTDQSSGADGSLCPAAFKNTFGYSSASYGAFDIGILLANLNANEPVLLSAATGVQYTWFLGLWVTSVTYVGAHEWVCDGIQTTTTTTCVLVGSQDNRGYTKYVVPTYMLHMNWGWNEVGTSDVDGWFSSTNWSVLNGNTVEHFQYLQDMTYNIHP